VQVEVTGSSCQKTACLLDMPPSVIYYTPWLQPSLWRMRNANFTCLKADCGRRPSAGGVWTQDSEWVLLELQRNKAILDAGNPLSNNASNMPISISCTVLHILLTGNSPGLQIQHTMSCKLAQPSS
jgi:hypothetical protein